MAHEVNLVASQDEQEQKINGGKFRSFDLAETIPEIILSRTCTQMLIGRSQILNRYLLLLLRLPSWDHCISNQQLEMKKWTDDEDRSYKSRTEDSKQTFSLKW